MINTAVELALCRRRSCHPSTGSQSTGCPIHWSKAARHSASAGTSYCRIRVTPGLAEGRRSLMVESILRSRRPK